VSEHKAMGGAVTSTTEAMSSEALASRGLAVIRGEILTAYQQLTNGLLVRADAETALWSELASTLSRTYSLRTALRTYQSFISKRMQVAAEDGRRALVESEQIMNDLGQALVEKVLLESMRFSFLPPNSSRSERKDGDGP
jgi:hypothetical protein